MDSNDGTVRLAFLLSASNKCLPPSYLKYRSYLNVYSSNIAAYFRLDLPKSLTSKNTNCPFCYTAWTQNTVSFKLIPSPRKRIKEPSSDQNKKEESTSSRNKLVLRCKVCTKRSSFSLVKKKNPKVKLEQLSTDNSKKKKKKKKKDKNNHAGLKIQCDKKVKKQKKQISSGSKNSHQSFNGSNPSKVTTCVKATNQILEKREKPAREETDVEYIPIGNTKKRKKKSKVELKPKLVMNPNALLNQRKSKKKIRNKIQFLKKAISQEKNTAKTSLNDFLTLVSK